MPFTKQRHPKCLSPGLVIILLVFVWSRSVASFFVGRTRSNGPIRSSLSVSSAFAPLSMSSSSSSEHQHQQPSSSSSSTTAASAAASHAVTVSYEGQSCEIQVQTNETILAALERWRVSDRLSLPEMPSDCRRGNCLTCTARMLHPKQTKKVPNGKGRNNQSSPALIRGSDGLSPAVSEEVADLGYVLTCSSYVQGDGLSLRLGENHKVWDTMYRKRWESEETQLIARRAMAREIRKSSEQNVERWKQETEEVFRKSGGGGDVDEEDR